MSKNEIDFADVDRMRSPKDAISLTDTVRGLPDVRLLRETAVKLLGPRPGDRILEIGCGTGENIGALGAITGPHGLAVGLDQSTAMIDEAKRRHRSDNQGFEFHVGDAKQLAFPDGSFDKCWCERTLQHLDDPESALREIHRVLRPGGTVLVLDTDWETLTIDPGEKSTTRALANLFCDSIQNGWIGRRLPRLCRSAGFEVRERFSRTVSSDNFRILFEVLGFSEITELAAASEILAPQQISEWKNALQAAERDRDLSYSVTIFGACAQRG